MIATCPDETKELLASELAAIGATDIQVLYRAVRFTCDERLYYEAHLRLRTASRLLRVIKDFAAKTPEMLFSQARRIKWHELFDVNHGFTIEGVPADRGPEFMRANDISKRVREALQDCFMKNVGKMPKVDLEEPKVAIVAFIHKGHCVLSFDTAGKALHKRGYRGPGHPAPLKETLAASILMLAGYDGSQALLDPMCGSGTIAIEAAMLALGKPPQMHRKKGQFLFEWLKDFDNRMWRTVQEEARAERRVEPPAPIYASDMSKAYVDMAQRNALKARVEKHITFDTKKFQDWEKPAETGVIVANLPYGERLSKDDGEAKTIELYKEIGDTLKRNFSGWRAVLLVAEASPYKFIGLKPKRKIPILNGSIQCKVLIFEMWDGGKSTGVKPRK